MAMRECACGRRYSDTLFPLACPKCGEAWPTPPRERKRLIATGKRLRPYGYNRPVAAGGRCVECTATGGGHERGCLAVD
jgi:hypothetical protein